MATETLSTHMSTRLTRQEHAMTAATAVRRRRPRRARRWRGWLYVLPAFAIYLVFVVLPGLQALYLSFYNWDGVGPATAAGLSNYTQVLSNPQLRGSLVHAAVLVVFFAGLPIVLGLLMAAILARHQRRGTAVFRTLFFLPYVVPLVAVGITWRWMYAVDGVVNSWLHAVGLGSVARAWLGDFTFALPAVGLVGTWALSGLCMVLFLAGAQKIDPNLYEAARLDGANPLQEFFAVTLPGLRGEIRVAMTVTVIAALASFDIVYVTTLGGPGNTTAVPSLLIYQLAFGLGEVGQAAALGVVLSVVIGLAVLLISRLIRTEES